MNLKPKWSDRMKKISIALLVFVGLAGSTVTGTAWAVDCGDTITQNTTLQKSDSIVSTVCPGDGLIVTQPGVTLNLNTFVLIGDGAGVGVKIMADDVTVKNGGVDRFETGIGTAGGARSGLVIEKIRPNLNVADGILVEGDNNELLGILAKRNGLGGPPGHRNGVTVIGNGNLLRGHNDEYNGEHGILVIGDGNTLEGNSVSENHKLGSVGNGMHIVGNGNTLDGNKASKMNIIGIFVDGNANELIENLVRKQDADGIIVTGDDNVLTDNRAISNKGTGILVTGSGDGNDSDGNIVSGNKIKNPQCSIYGVTTPDTCIVK
jgi:parallel beta-helix repeat protein